MPEIENQEDVSNVELPKVDELTALKQRADAMGVAYHPSIGIEKLREKVKARIENKPDPDAGLSATAPPAGSAEAEAETHNAKRFRLKKEANRLVRINLTCLNPAKREWPGEIFTVGNAMVGTFRKYVPFNTTDGWHVPVIILKMLEERECQIFVTKTVRIGGNDQKTREGKSIKEFAIQYLPNLTENELRELGRRQAMANGATEQ